LSENADFCERIQTETNGQITFVGPPPSAIQAMGSKSKSKAIMEAAGVATAPGFYGDTDEEQEPLHLLERATEDVGFPLLIKAVMGGGGKGMRIVWSDSEFLEKLEACKQESLNAFGDEKVLLEKYLVNPRHVEVQVVADHHGNVVSLHERDCSLQRRHQKVIEEAPASDLSEQLRQNLGEMGCKAAKAVGYINAGTVEFLLESGSNNSSAIAKEEGGFYFCEMNTRLQVEHPITELITGIDLVEWQLMVAAGEALPIHNSSEIPCIGHAFEARIYAEKPGDGKFLPASGTVWHHDPPAPPNTNAGESSRLLSSSSSSPKGIIRVDTGIQTGQEVGVDYDPMICKLIVHETSREAALNKLVEALQDYKIAGVPTNIDFLINCAKHDTFRRQGATNTGFLDDHLDEVLPPIHPTLPAQAIAMASFATMLVLEGRVGVQNLEASRRTQASPWNSWSGSWRNSGTTPNQTLKLADGTVIDCTPLRDGSYNIKVTAKEDEDEETEGTNTTTKSSTTFHVNGTLSSDHQMNVVINGSEKVSLTAALREVDGRFQICLWPQSASLRNKGHYFWEVEVPNPRIPSSSTSLASAVSGTGIVLAPMPGKISKIRFEVGDLIQEGDVLVVMEAMKMYHTVHATTRGVVERIDCKVGDVVADQAVLVVVVEEKQHLESDAQSDNEIESESDEEQSKAV
jgi:3-methylcrotonyl-CoA carboxylase alpha subunit